MDVPGARSLLEAMSEAVYAVDRDRRITYWNAAAEQLTGYKASEVVGHRCRDNILNHVDNCGTRLCVARCPLLATMQDGQVRAAHVFLHHSDGHRVPVAVRSAALYSPDGTIIGAVEVFHDDTLFQATAERLDLVEHEALTDTLTGIANRRRLERVLSAREDEQRRYGHSYAVIFCDVDNFKRVNDHYGYEVGDTVLRAIAEALQASTRPSDTVGRWGGDEFLIIAPAADEDRAAALAERMRQTVLAMSPVVDHGPAVTMSMGIAVARPGDSSAQVVARAGTATREAKKTPGTKPLLYRALDIPGLA
jgi:diguanylate cyclase (GGDEF)-like protein/PAS domain S-box-containing protein